MSRQFDLIGDRYVLRRGLPWSITVRRLAPGRERAPIDMTGCTARFEVINALHPPPYHDVRTFPVEVAQQAGLCHVILSAQDTGEIRFTAGRYRLLVTDPQGGERVLLYGRLAILEHGK
jgi:hypothetical protein